MRANLAYVKFPVLDPEWDEDESPIVACADPVLWGRPASQSAHNGKTDAYFAKINVQRNVARFGPLISSHAEPRTEPRATFPRRRMQRKPVLVAFPGGRPSQQSERELIKLRMAAFPHADEMMRDAVAREFLDWGRKEAQSRAISENDWLWSRSRYLAKSLGLI